MAENLNIGDSVYDGIYFSQGDPGVIKHIRKDGWCLVNYKVSVGAGTVFPPDRLNKICNHHKTYVAVRHVSGIRLIKCSDCGAQI